MKFNLVAEQQGNTKINVSVDLTTEELASTLRHNRDVLEFLFNNSFTIKDIVKELVKAYEEIIRIQRNEPIEKKKPVSDDFFNIDKIIKEVK